MDQSFPIVFTQVLDLPQLGIQEKYCSFHNLTLESDKYICVRESGEDGTSPQLSIISFNDIHNINKRPISAESSLMNPSKNILALKAGQTVQVYDLDKKTKINSHVLKEPAIFCKWISDDIMAIVTEYAVYHWDFANADPVKAFDRSPDLRNHQIIHYKANKDLTWFCLVGIAQANNMIVGNMQLYSKEKNISQTKEGHACVFIDYNFPGTSYSTTLFAFATRTPGQSKLYITEVTRSQGGTTGSVPTYGTKTADILFPQEAMADFPVILETSKRYQVLYMITKLGYLHIYDIPTATLIYRNKIAQDQDTVFVATNHGDGIYCANKRGKVFNITLNEDTIIPYLVNQGNLAAAIGLASRANLPGADELFVKQFQRLIQEGRYQEAAIIAADSPRGILRTPQTIQLYKSLQGQPPPLLVYFNVLLQRGRLNKYETLELAYPIIQQNKRELLQKYIAEDKLDYSDEFIEALKPYDPKLALEIYVKTDNKEKIVQMLAEFGQYEKLVHYCNEKQFNPDWVKLITALCNTNSKGAVQLAKLVLNMNPPPVNREVVVDIFESRSLLPETTELLLEILGEDKPEDGPLQTKLLEMNLLKAPQIAEEIFKNKLFSHYDSLKIAEKCEKAQLYHRALQHYQDITNRKRILRNAHLIPPEFLVEWFGTLSNKDFIECLREMLTNNLKQNLNICVQIAIRYVEKISPGPLISLFEEVKSHEGLFSFLNPILPLIDDKEVHYKFIEAASKLGRIADVERVCRESNHYDPERVRDFLKDIKLSDPLPLIIVCDRFGYIADLTKYLNKNSMRRAIEVYVTQINPENTPIVVGALLDDDTPEEYIKGLINSVGSLCPIGRLVEEVEKRNRLKLIHSWLEARYREGSQDPHLHNAMAKIFIDTRQDPEKFLLTNPFYDHLVVGKYCESRDPNLAFLAYKASKGKYDRELVEIANKAALFKQLSRYLVERMDMNLWQYVLTDESLSENRRNIIEQVQVALKETQVPDQVTVAVKAFMNSELQNELVGLLESIIIDGTNKAFSENTNLQNLLILTSIRAHTDGASSEKIMEYIKRLNHYNSSEIASIAAKNGLFEESFVAYSKVNMNIQAVDILLDHIKSLDRAKEFAAKVEEPEVYSRVGKAQLDNDLVEEAIESFMKANDPQYYHEVIAAANRKNLYEELAKYLLMARQVISETKIDSEYIYVCAKLNQLQTIEQFIQGSQRANIQDVGERLFDEGHYEAARILFSFDHNYSKLALTLIKLEQYPEAVEAARKSNNVSTWKSVGKACIDVKEFRLARVCGLNVIIHGDELLDLIRYYENRGYTEELITLLEDGLTHERAHPGMFTELAILYAKYDPSKLMNHLRQHSKRLNISRVCMACEANLLWKELVFLLVVDEEYDRAAEVMMTHVDAWDQNQFYHLISKVKSSELCYKAVRYFIETRPMLLNDLLLSMNARVDYQRIVDIAREYKILPLIKGYLLKIQEANDLAINTVVNEIYIEEEDYELLRNSIENYNNFDALALAKQLENHDLVEFRRIASDLYRQKGKHDIAVELLKKDALVEDSIRAASLSKNPKVAEELLEHFLKKGNPHAFAACLYTCYDLIRPDVALELAWKYKQIDFAFPYIIQFIREYTTKVDEMMKKQENVGGFDETRNVIPVQPPQDPSFHVPPPQMMMTTPAPFTVVPQPQGMFHSSSFGHQQPPFTMSNDPNANPFNDPPFSFQQGGPRGPLRSN